MGFPTAIYNPFVDDVSVATLKATKKNDPIYSHATAHVNDAAEIVALETLIGTNAAQTTPTGSNRILASTSASASTWTASPTLTNLTLGGTLAVTGATTLSSTLAAGATTITGTLATSGASTLTGAVTAQSTLAVTGATTLSSTLAAGATTITGNEIVTGSLTVDTSTLFVDSVNNVVGIGTASPTAGIKLDIRGDMWLQDASISYYWNQTSGAADNRLWRTNVASESMLHQLVDDANVVATTYMGINRTGTTVDTVNFPSSATITVGATGSATLGSVLDVRGQILSKATTPGYSLSETDAAADKKIWRTTASSGGLAHSAVSDDEGTTTNYLTVARTGTTVDSVTLTPTKTVVKKARQSNTTNGTQNVLEQEGWGFILGDGLVAISKAVTFETAFSSSLVRVFVNFLGKKTGSNPSSETDTSGIAIGDVSASGQLVSSTGFTAVVIETSGGGSLGATDRYMFSWLARGPV